MSLRRAVFVDRDGTITESVIRDGKPFAPTQSEDLKLLPGVKEALQTLHDAGFLLIVATNQPDVRTGKTTMAAVEAMHAELRQWLPMLDDIKACYHIDADNCDCRKPKPGMLTQSAQKFGIDLRASWMIGDRWRDVATGQAAGCRTVFIDFDYNEQQPDAPDFTVKAFPEIVEIILKNPPAV